MVGLKSGAVEKLSPQHSTLISACDSLSGDKPLRAHTLPAATLWLPTSRLMCVNILNLGDRMT
jgi:hypothetical protein